MSGNLLQAAVREFLTEAVRDRLRVSGLHIDGVEVTQAIQYRSAELHLTDPADRGPDNSVMLVADKPAMVRVYVRNLPAAVEGVTGSVMVQRRRYGVWVDAGKLVQQGHLDVTAEPDPGYAAERGELKSSLNFIVPAAEMRGRMRLKVRVEAPGDSRAADTIVDVDASLLQTLRVRGIPVEYVGPDAAGNPVRLAAPTLAAFRGTATTTLRMYPVSQTPDISLSGTMTWRAPLDGAIVDGQCPASWIALLFWLGLMRVADGNRADSMYYALLPSAIPVGGAFGCGGGGAGVGAGRDGDGLAMAHELGHVVGFSHAPCGLGPGDAGNPAYPAYEPYDTAANRMGSIGEYGLDVTGGFVYSPRFTSDFMSYCGSRWISLFHAQALLRQQVFDPTHVSAAHEGLPEYLDEQYHGPTVFDRPDPPPPGGGRRLRLLAEPDPVRLIVVTGMFSDDRIEIASLMRLETGPSVGGERIAGTFVELLDANARVLQRVPLRRMALQSSCGCGCGGGRGDEPPSGLVQALLPDVEGGQVLRVVRDDKELWSRQATSQPPTIGDVGADVDGDQLRVRWQTFASDAYPIERIVRWSADDGRRWQALAVKLDVDEAVVPIQGLTSGGILVQVVVSDGFHGATSDPVRVEIPRRPPSAAILWPVEGATVRTDQHLRLWGTATASDGSVLPSDALRWRLDGEAVGIGPELWVALPEWEGEHRATLSVRDGHHQHAEMSVTFQTSCSGRRPYRSRGTT